MTDIENIYTVAFPDCFEHNLEFKKQIWYKKCYVFTCYYSLLSDWTVRA